MMKFDLFKLHSSEDKPHSWIWAKLDGRLIKEEYLKLLNKKSQNSIILDISRKLNAGFSTIGKHLIRIKKTQDKLLLPLPIIIELTEIIKKKRVKDKLIEQIEYLLCKTAPEDKTKSLKYINKTFAKIIGAHVADGYLKHEKGSYRIKVCDGKKDIVKIFSEWIKETFEINPIIRFSKRDNTWICWFNNKIIGRYFENILEIPVGKKSEIIREPNLVKSSPFEIRKAFALGVFTFDGGVKTTGMVSISSKSENLINDLYGILTIDEVKVRRTHNIKKNSWLLESISGRNKRYLKKWKDYFEKGTSKYKKLEFFINPTSISKRDLLELFSPYHKGKINLSDVYEVANKKGLINNKEIAEEVSKTKNVSNITVYKYLYVLKKACVIK